MFLRRTGASGRFTFDVIYSCLQKSMRRGDETLAIEMGYEFREYPNALKKRLLQNCSEDCPDFNLMTEIYDTNSNLNDLMKFIPIVCRHIKCRDGLWLTRLAAEQPLLMENIFQSNQYWKVMIKIH